MKKTNDHLPADCRQIKKLLLEKPQEAYSDTESSLISLHLTGCESCRQYQLLLSSLEKTAAPPSPNFLAPDPEIYHSLLHRWSALHPSPGRKTGKFVQTIKEVMSYRIPLYQVVSGLVIAIMLAGLYNYFPLPEWRVKPPAASRPAADLTKPAFSDVFIQLDFNTAGKFGSNMKEDSILTRFIHYSL